MQMAQSWSNGLSIIYFPRVKDSIHLSDCLPAFQLFQNVIQSVPKQQGPRIFSNLSHTFTFLLWNNKVQATLTVSRGPSCCQIRMSMSRGIRAAEVCFVCLSSHGRAVWPCINIRYLPLWEYTWNSRRGMSTLCIWVPHVITVFRR